MQRILLLVLRISVTLWLGAALFFSAVAIQPIRHPKIEAATRPQLALILFPGYYQWGFFLLVVGCLSAICCWNGATAGPTRRRLGISLVLVVLALACLVADRLMIYAPLEKMMQASLETEVQPAEFRPYHLASMTINGVMAALTLAGALLACWPDSIAADSTSSKLPA